MLRFLILLLSLMTLSFAEPIVKITSDISNIKDFEIGYFINNDAKLAFKDIASVEFERGKNKDSLGTDVINVWIKIKLYNSTQNTQKLFLHQNLAFTFRSLEYFEVDANATLINRKRVAPFEALAKEQLNGSNALFKFMLKPKEEKTIYVHQITPAYHFYNFSILSQKESTQYLINQKIDSVLIFGTLMALALYNLLIYISSRYKEYLYYSLYLISSTLWIFYIYGAMAHYVYVYGEIAFRFNYGLMFGPIFLTLFIQAIFNTKEKYIKEHYFLNSVIVLLSLNMLYGLISFDIALQLLSLILNYIMIVFLGVAISIYRKGDKIIKIFLFAHIFYLIFNIYALLFYMGIVDFTYISSRGIGIGIVIEALMLSYLVSYKFKIMEKEKEEARLKQIDLMLLATTDPMTKLYNRRYFLEISEKILALSQRNKEELSLIILDIDHFKSVNDTYGHKVGDDVIVSLANLLQEQRRKSDVVCRWGGEEFVILFPKTNLENCFEISQKLRRLVEGLELKLENNEILKFTVSIGIAQVDKTNTIESAISRADAALYEAKKSGRNRVCTN